MANKPTHTAYTVRNYKKGDDENAEWLKIGVAFMHKDGMGLDVVLDAVPVDGRIALRINKDKPTKAE
jgi:hypothetical protein